MAETVLSKNKSSFIDEERTNRILCSQQEAIMYSKTNQFDEYDYTVEKLKKFEKVDRIDIFSL